LLDSVEAVDEFQEGVVALYRWEVGQTLRIRQIRFSTDFDLHPQLELYTTSGG
jgi:hypothetical protein